MPPAILMSDGVLDVIVGATLVLFIAAVAFAIGAVALRARSRRRARRWERLERSWEPLLLEVLDGAPARTLTDAVDTADRLRFVDFVQRYLRRITGAEAGALRDLMTPFLPPIAHQLDAALPEVRTRAVQTLGRFGAREYRGRIIAALDDPTELVAMAAAMALAREGTREGVDAVLARLPRFRTWRPAFVASVLAAAADQTARYREAADMANGRTAEVLMETLRQLKDPASADVAASRLSTADRAVRLAGLRLLAELGRPDHAAAVRPLALDADPLVRGRALETLAELGTPDDHQLLATALEDASPWVALAAARGLVAARRLDLLQAAVAQRPDLLAVRELLLTGSAA